MSSTRDANVMHVALCGAGPAAAGLLSYLRKVDLLDDMLARGVAIIEATSRIGPGRLGSYLIPANSHGRIFLECYNNVAERSSAHPPDERELSRLVLSDNEAPFLPHAAALMEQLGSVLAADVGAYPRSRILTGTRVIQIARHRSAWGLTLRDSDGTDSRLLARNVVLAVGGMQSRVHMLSRELLPGITLSPYSLRVIGSDAFLRAHPDLLQPLFDRGAGSGPIVVVGGSHSAVSVVGRLLANWETVRGRRLPWRRGRRIVMLRRRPFRFYYGSAEEARRAKYEFDPLADVCPVTGKVNRYGGLRYQAATFAQRLTSDAERFPVRHVLLSAEPTRGESKALRRLCSRASLIISCMGYHARPVKLHDEDGNSIPILHDPDGGMHVDDEGCVYDTSGEPLRGLYALGLGAGIRVGSCAGGEPSYNGRLDAVYLYHNEVARAIAAHVAA